MSALMLETQTADGTARVRLPEQFANATVTVQALSDTEVVVRLAASELESAEVPPLQPLSNEDRDFLLNLLDNPPEPNDVLKRAWARHKERYG